MNKASKPSIFFNPHKSFFSLWIVWTFFTTITVITFYLAYITCKSSEIPFDPENINLVDLVDIFKVPLAFFALNIPITAVLSANHRSEQTREQIALSRDQNNFSNYYKHIEEFEKYCEGLAKPKVMGMSTRALHSFVYPDSRDGVFSCEEAKDALNDYATGLATSIVKISARTGTIHNHELIRNEIGSLSYIAAKKFHLDISGLIEGKKRDGTETKILSKRTMEERATKLLFFIDKVLRFEPNYTPPDGIKEVMIANQRYKANKHRLISNDSKNSSSPK